MYGMSLMNYKPESLEGQVIANLMESWRRSPVKMAEIIEEGKSEIDNGRNLKAITNGIMEFRLIRSKKRKENIKRKQKALRLLDSFTIKEVMSITGLGQTTLNRYISEQNASAIAV